MTLFETIGVVSANSFVKQSKFNFNALKNLGTQAVNFFNKPNIKQPIETGLNAVKTTANKAINAGNTAREFVSNTFRPGTASLKARLNETGRLYNTPQSANMWTHRQGPENVYKRMRTAKDERLVEGPAGAAGYYSPSRNVAVSHYPINSQMGRETMRHELAHGVQNNSSRLAFADRQAAEAYKELGIPYALSKHINTYENSLQGLVGRLSDSDTPYRKALGKFLGEVNSNASEKRNILGQITQGINFAVSPRKARFYSNYYKNTPFGQAYKNIHYGTVYGSRALAGLGAAGAGAAASAAVNHFKQPTQTEGR